MNGLIDSAREYRRDTHRREVAHEVSAGWHGKWGARLGYASTALSAIVGTSVFYTFVAKFGLDAKNPLYIPNDWLARGVFYAVVVISLAAPVVSAWQSYELGEQAKHTSSNAGYFRMTRDLDKVINRYIGVNMTDKEQEDAGQEIDRISGQTSQLRQSSPRITKKAYEDAETQITKEGTHG